MHFVDFITELGAKQAPIDAHGLRTLQIQLRNSFDKQVENFKMKEENNKKTEDQIFKLDQSFKEASENGEMDRASDIAYRIKEMKSTIDKPTLIERACNFLDNPIVKFLLMLTFGLAAAWIVKRKLFGSRDEDLEDDQEDVPGTKERQQAYQHRPQPRQDYAPQQQHGYAFHQYPYPYQYPYGYPPIYPSQGQPQQGQ